ncbi:ArnT family glycosyltransferase [Companilactobacillus huachuanensis]|uniref:ArnT family glycosyltransferase n=1 Tax=Companilactobacillus huachuanensis TaxID=2559914 RepID=A0ABW1RKL5_9LACO|nr:glycosyltransferase family 39 protein [Companilactobacillus huachuanensis]
MSFKGENIIETFQTIINKTILACVAIFTTAAFLLMLVFYYHNFLFQNVHNVVIGLVFIMLIILIGYGLTRIKTDDHTLNWLVVISMLLVFMIMALFWISKVPSIQLSDFGNFWDRLLDYKIGDPLYQTDNDYFSKYAYQSGYFVYAMIISKIFGYHIFAIQFLNVVYQALILLFTYLFVVKIFNNIKMARLSILILMIDLDWFALNSQASNQYLGSLFYLVTFYLIMQNKLKYYILAGITLTGGCLIRPIGPVVIAGIVVYALIYLLLKNKDYHATLKVLLTLIIYFVLFSLSSWGIKASGINAYGLTNNDPEWKFVTGLNYQSNGTYSPDMDKLINPDKTRKQMSKVEKAQLHKEIAYLNENHAWVPLFIHKTQGLWSSRTMATDAANIRMTHSIKTVDRINFLAYVGSIILITFSWLGSLALFKTKFNDNLYLLLLPLMAFAVVQLLIEVQGRYRIEFLPVIAVVGSLGLYNALHALHPIKLRSKKTAQAY